MARLLLSTPLQSNTSMSFFAATFLELKTMGWNLMTKRLHSKQCARKTGSAFCVAKTRFDGA